MQCPFCDNETLHYIETRIPNNKSRYYCDQCECIWTAWQAAEIAELQRQLSIALEALGKYADKKNWSAIDHAQLIMCVFSDYSAESGLPLLADRGYEIAQEAIAKIERVK